MKRKTSVFAILLATLLLPALAAAAGSIQLKLIKPRGQNSIHVGDIFYIEYILNNIDARVPAPSSVPGANLNYFDLTSQSSSVVQSGSEISRKSQYVYTATLRAKSEGTFTFGPVTAGGSRSNAVKYTIASAASKPSAAAKGAPANAANASGAPKYIGKGDGNLFLRASVSKTTAYEQEALVYTVKLYCSYSAVKFIGATSAPKFQGFVVEESKNISSSLTYETYNGRTYASAIIARYIIFPQMTGQLKVLGNTYTISVDEHEYYNDPYWGSLSYSTPLQLNVTPNDLIINVRKLPQPQPADFSGGVGKFTITSSLPSSNLKTNEAASIVYTVKGTGNLKYIKLPELSLLYPPKLEIYSPETKISSNVSATNVSGDVRFDYSIMPQNTGTYRIPDVKLVYFNPETGKYETSVARGYTVEVGKGEASSKSQTKGMRRFDPQLMSASGSPKASSRPIVTSAWYWLIYAVLILSLAGAAIAYRRHLKLNSDVLAMKSRKANREARRRLRKAAACMKHSDAAQFYDEVILALWGYVGDKLKIPASELNRDNVSGKLRDRGIAETLIERFIALLDECEFAKYAPAASSGNMPEVYSKATETINGLESAFKKSPANTGTDEH